MYPQYSRQGERVATGIDPDPRQGWSLTGNDVDGDRRTAQATRAGERVAPQSSFDLGVPLKPDSKFQARLHAMKG